MITVEQRTWSQEKKWSEPTGSLKGEAQLVFVFGDRELIENENVFFQVERMYHDAYILLASTAGNILGNEVSEGTITLSALNFEKTKIWFAETTIDNTFDSVNTGKKLAEFLPTENLVHSFVLSDGLIVNGSELVASINKHLPSEVTVTGGLAGDGEDFKNTVVGINGTPKNHRVALIGFYSTELKVGYATGGGWETTESSYMITKSEGNVLYELDGKPALEVYKQLLGSQATKLPGSALLFPLQIEASEQGAVTRTILSIDEETNSMTFAGDMPEGKRAVLMNSNKDNLINSAERAGADALTSSGAQFALLVSCVGRHMVLKEDSEKEVAAVRRAIGSDVPVHGFYSYGELCPSKDSGKQCLLHNQTMTVTTFFEN